MCAPIRFQFLQPLTSAYAAVRGSEPRFTTNSVQGSSMAAVFKGTLDYIFTSSGATPVEVAGLPCDHDENAPLVPDASEASDHYMIAATVSVANPARL